MSLQGKRIVVTRAANQADSLMNLLKEKGAIPLLYPCISIAPREIEFDSRDYDWLIITSSNTAFALKGQIVSHLKIAAIGQTTAQSVKSYLGKEAAFISEIQSAEALAKSLPLETGTRVLLPQSAIAKDNLSQRLSERGAVVHSITAYDTLPGTGGEDIPNLLDSLDAITFTSGSCVENFTRRIYPKKASHLPAAVIGDNSATAAQVHGYQTIVPQEFTIEAMVEALEAYFT
jgi:uroporphyrinogen-III synthase